MVSGRTNEGCLPICWIERILLGARERHLDEEVLLRAAGICPALRGTPHARIAPGKFNALWRRVTHALNDEFLAQDSRGMKIGSYAMLCNTVIHCKTLESALRRALRFFDLTLDDIKARLSREQGFAKLSFHSTPRGDRDGALAHEILIIMLHGLMCRLTGRCIPLVSARFSFPEPAHSAEYRNLFLLDQLGFDAERTTLTFDGGYLDLPVILDEQTLPDFLRTAPARIALKYTIHNSLAAEVCRHLQALSINKWPDFEEMAAHLQISCSTLRRRLNEDRQSYQSIKDQLRCERAIDHLCRSTRNIADIAFDLGFAEPGAFHRAFKKWTGLRPGEYRHRLNSGRGTAQENERCINSSGS